MIKKPIQKISYLYDQSTFVEHREYFLKEEFDYPILDRPCPEYIPEKDVIDMDITPKLVLSVSVFASVIGLITILLLG